MNMNREEYLKQYITTSILFQERNTFLNLCVYSALYMNAMSC
jgi:hypothetical protein